jgi:hypothetical protein
LITSAFSSCVACHLSCARFFFFAFWVVWRKLWAFDLWWTLAFVELR